MPVRTLSRSSAALPAPTIVDDATTDPSLASDPYVIAQRCRSLAGIPVSRHGELAGFVILESRLVAGAFTPQLLNLAQALVGA